MTEEVEQQDDTPTTAIAEITAEADERNAPVDPIEELARESGWSPKESWKGDPDDWRDARAFVQHGMKRSRESATELRSLRSSVEHIGRTSEVLMRRQVEEAREAARQEFASAVENKDHAGAERARESLSRIEASTQSGPPPETQDFLTRNAAWFGRDPAATAVAHDMTARLAAQNVSVAEQLRQAEEAVKARFPEHFGSPRQPAKKAASVAAPTSRVADVVPRAKGANDLPAEARRAGADFVRRGMVKTLDDYARVYFEENA